MTTQGETGEVSNDSATDPYTKTKTEKKRKCC